MTGSRPAVCCALDPLESRSARGFAVHRHCLLPAGHTSYHQTYDSEGNLVHMWMWEDDDAQHGLISSGRQIANAAVAIIEAEKAIQERMFTDG